MKNNNPDDGLKSKFYGWLGAFDFYHHADDARKLFYILGGMMLCSLPYSIWIKIIAAFITSGLFKSLGMKWIRS